MQIQEGKFYKTRDGQKVGPMVKSGILYGLISGGILEYYENGQKSHVYDMDDDIIEEWTDTPTIWEDMTREEKGALLLAAFEGKRIDCLRVGHGSPWYETLVPQWDENFAYRIKPEPKRETVAMTGHDRGYWCFGSDRVEDRDTHRIIIPKLDGDIMTGNYTSEAGEVIIVEQIND